MTERLSIEALSAMRGAAPLMFRDHLRAHATEFLARIPADLPLPVPKGDRETYDVPQELWGLTRDELTALVERGEMPFI